MKTSGDHHTALKAFTAFLILALGAVLLFMYEKNSDKVYLDGNLETFTVLSLLGGALLIGLLYLVNKPHHHSPAKSSKRKKK